MLSREDFINKKIVILYSRDGEKISFKNDNVVIVDKKKKLKLQYSCYKIISIWVIGPITITSGILERLKKYNITLVCFTYGFRRYLTINSGLEGNTELKRIQYAEKDSLYIAKSIVINKIKSQIRIIQKKRQKNEHGKIELLKTYIEQIKNVETIAGVMGYEGNASRVYFRSIFDNIEWKGRRPRAKHDIANFMLDMGYSLLFAIIETLLSLFGFDLYVGNLHQEFYKRKSLVCDIVEPFRPLVDYTIRKMFNLKIIKKEDFYYNGISYRLKGNKEISLNYYTYIMKKLLEHRETMYKFVQQYYRWIKNPQRINKGIIMKEWNVNDISNL